jgi:hypothetical protein
VQWTNHWRSAFSSPHRQIRITPLSSFRLISSSFRNFGLVGADTASAFHFMSTILLRSVLIAMAMISSSPYPI